MIDNLNLGHYFLKVIDTKSNQLIFSRGFSSLFNEWQTTADALRGASKVIHESFIIPFPKDKIIAQLWKRDNNNLFTKLLGTMLIDPSYDFIKTDALPPNILTYEIQKKGDPKDHVDLVIIGDGYTKAEWEKFKKDSEKYSTILMGVAPFNKNISKFNITAALSPSPDSGTDEPDRDIWVRNTMNTHFHTFRSNRYLMTFDNNTMRNVAGAIPYDFVYILVNTSRYGGGAIYQLYAVATSDNKYSDYVFIHEFGHHFGGLGDEYYTSDVAYTDFYGDKTEPWEPNVTALLDPNNLKWKSFVEEDTPIPTPWNKSKYDSTYAARSGGLKQILKEDPYYGKTGAFEGSGYSSEGLYRPSVDCIMFSKGIDQGFDPVCRNAIQRMIDFYCK